MFNWIISKSISSHKLWDGVQSIQNMLIIGALLCNRVIAVLRYRAILPISFRVTSLKLDRPYNWTSASDVTQMNVGKLIILL